MRALSNCGVTADALGPVNAAGLDFYADLVDALRGAGITPAVTLYDWDMPQALEDAGGWPVRATAERFAEYARVVAAALGDRVPLFITLNEPWCSAYLGYASGVHAPGRTDPALALAAVHHLNLAHGLAAAAVREVVPAPRVGVTLNLAWVRPETDSAADVLADTAAVTDWGFVRAGDAETIAAPLDVLGLNYYSPLHVRHWTRERPRETADGHGDSAATPWIACDDIEFPRRPGPTTAMGWGIDPRGMTELLLRIARSARTSTS